MADVKMNARRQGHREGLGRRGAPPSNRAVGEGPPEEVTVDPRSK